MPSVTELEKLPDELFQIVESFKKFLREQKAYRDQRFTAAPILEVGKDIEEFTSAFQRVEADSRRNAQLVQQIKDDTTKLLRNSEMAYSMLRSHFATNPTLQQQQSTIPSLLGGIGTQNSLGGGVSNQNFNSSNFLSSINPSLSGTTTNLSTNGQANNPQQSGLSQQHPMLHQQQPFYLSGSSPYGQNLGQFVQNTTASAYFSELADQFEARMNAYGEQVKELKMCLDSITRPYNVDELFQWLKKQHELLGEIAAKIYVTHERIMEKKSELDKFNLTSIIQQ